MHLFAQFHKMQAQHPGVGGNRARSIIKPAMVIGIRNLVALIPYALHKLFPFGTAANYAPAFSYDYKIFCRYYPYSRTIV